MKINGHELESRYISMIIEINRANSNPHWTDKLWVNKFKRKLKRRLEKLEESYKNRFLDKNAYRIWKQMIIKVL